MRRSLYIFLILFPLLAGFRCAAFADESLKSELTVRVSYPGSVQLEGDIAVNDRILLYSRE